jgi:antiphage defense system Thoeris ThsB-like protein
MARRVFFSFHYSRDAWRVGQVRNSAAIGRFEMTPFLDAAEWQSITRRGDAAIKAWIDQQIDGNLRNGRLGREGNGKAAMGEVRSRAEHQAPQGLDRDRHQQDL